MPRYNFNSETVEINKILRDLPYCLDRAKWTPEEIEENRRQYERFTNEIKCAALLIQFISILTF